MIQVTTSLLKWDVLIQEGSDFPVRIEPLLYPGGVPLGTLFCGQHYQLNCVLLTTSDLSSF
jgi:hypothetical protein